MKSKNRNEDKKSKKAEIVSELDENYSLELYLENNNKAPVPNKIESDKTVNEKAKKTDEHKLKIENFDKNLSLLNVYFFIILSSFVITSNIVIWLLISH